MNDFNTRICESTTNTWITPREVLSLLGHFDMDPCAALRQPWPTADVMVTEAENGLLRGWHGRVWCNPPYGSAAKPFMQRMAAHDGGGLALIFARTGTSWFQDCVLATARAMFLWRGRIRFCREDGTQRQAANAASCLIAWDRRELALLRGLEAMNKGKLALLRQ